MYVKQICFSLKTLFAADVIANLSQTLLDMYSDGKPLGFGIGVGGERWKEQRKFAMRVLNEMSEGSKGDDTFFVE
jgi:hypothetical protein